MPLTLLKTTCGDRGMSRVTTETILRDIQCLSSEELTKLCNDLMLVLRRWTGGRIATMSRGGAVRAVPGGSSESLRWRRLCDTCACSRR
jgi:hypothetical protein